MLSLPKQGQQTIANTTALNKKTQEAIAMLVYHYSKSSVSELVNNSVMQAIETAREQIQGAIREEIEKLCTKAATASTSVVDIAKQVHTSLAKVADRAPSYSKVAAGSVASGANLELIVWQAIHTRQLLFKVVDIEGFPEKTRIVPPSKTPSRSSSRICMP